MKIRNRLTLFIFLTILYVAVFILTIKLIPQRYSSKPLYDPLIRDVSTVFNKEPFWKWECIDTMKYSRDTARAWNDRSELLEKEITLQIEAIKETGANCVALGTPYESEFVPFLSKWVEVARKNKLKIWFRGNVAGWEKWFDYEKINTKEEHNNKVYKFIVENAELFENEDVFTPAPEPENGGLGDPRHSGDIRSKFNDFLVSSFQNCENAFSKIDKNIKCGVFSSNFDVANQSLNPETVQKIGNVVAIDHYVSNPTSRYEKDILALNQKYGGAKIWIGEFGGPIPDLNGQMDEKEQAKLIEVLMNIFYKQKNVIEGINYWTLKGGSTKLLNDNEGKREAMSVLKNYFSPGFVRGYTTPRATIKNELGDEIKANEFGRFTLALPAGLHKIQIGFFQKTVEITSGEVTLLN